MKLVFPLNYLRDKFKKVTLLILLSGGFQLFAQSVTLNSPNGDEVWEASTSQIIRWESENIVNVKIEYSLDNGLSWGIITNATSASTGEYTWVTADAKTPYVLIRVSDATIPFIYDVSDESFSLVINETRQLAKTSGTTSTSGSAIKIMPLGDSITWGTNPDDATSPGYRRSLYLQLTNAGYNVDFVGSLNGGLPDNFDRDNEGHPGWYTLRNTDHSKSMYHQLNNFLTSNPPEIVLLHIGTNDIGSGLEPRTASEIADAVIDLLDIIFAFNSDVITIIAKIIDRNDSFHQKTLDFNTSLNSKVNSLPSGQIDQVIITDIYDAIGLWSSTYFSDILHPNSNGYQLMADTWFDELRPVLPLLVDVTVLLQGPYAGSSTMNTNLRTLSSFPLSQPYNASPWNYTGTESVGSVPAGVVDWVLVELRIGTAASTTVARRAAFLKADGSIVDLDGTSLVNFVGISHANYYIVVKHRNHLEVMSNAAVTLTNFTLTHNFTTGSSKYSGGSAGAINIDGSGVWGMIAGDATGDGQVKYNGIGNDILPILIKLGYVLSSTVSGYNNEDINLNGQVKYNGIGNDILVILQNLNYVLSSVRSTQVPNN